MSVVVVLMAVLCTAAGARAQEEGDYLMNLERAKSLYRQAEGHFAQGQFEQALELYQQAHKLAPGPMFLLGIGQAHKAMGHCDKALVFFERYQLEWPDAPNHKMVQGLMDSCRRTLKRQREEAEQERLRKEREAQPPPPPPQEPRPAPRQGLDPLWFWSTVGLSGALLVTGAVTGGLAYSKNKEYKDEGTTVPERLDLRDSGKDLQLVSTVTFIAGGVAAGAAALLYFYTGWDREGQTQVSAGLGGMSVRGTF